MPTKKNRGMSSILALKITEVERISRLKTMTHWSLPLISLAIWWGMLTVMLALWGSGQIDYLALKNDKRQLVYVSTVGSEGLKPLFVCGSFMMGTVAMISTIAERMLAHRGRLVKEKQMWEQYSSWVTISTGFLGYINLFLVAIFDSRDYFKLHVIALAMFLGFLGISSFTIVTEFFFLDPEYIFYRRLQISCFVRLVWSVLEVGLIVSFTMYAVSSVANIGCLLEWIVAYLFGVHLILLVYVLSPYSPGELAQAEERFGDAIECLMFGALGWTMWVKNYREICIQARLSRRFMTRKNKVGFYVYKIEIDKEDEHCKNWQNGKAEIFLDDENNKVRYLEYTDGSLPLVLDVISN